MIVTDKKLWKYNLAAAILHGVQGTGMLIASQVVDSIKAFKKDITRSYLVYNPETKGLDPAQTKAFTIEIGVMAAVFLLLSAFAHSLVLLTFNKIYLKHLRKNMNYIRWYEYAISSSVMICAIAALFGMYDLGSHILLFFGNACMNFFGLLMEEMNSWKMVTLRAEEPRLDFYDITTETSRTVNGNETINTVSNETRSIRSKIDWTPFWFGCVAGAASWIVMAIYFFSGPDISQIPGFVFGILLSYVIFFNTFPINMALQYAQVGPWKDYRYGELWYMFLSLASKSLLAWLVFGGTFQPND